MNIKEVAIVINGVDAIMTLTLKLIGIVALVKFIFLCKVFAPIV